MKGSIRERPSRKPSKGPKTWELQVYHGIDPETGKRLRHFETFKGDYPAAEKRLRQILTDIDKSAFVAVPPKLTVGKVLDMWLESYVKTNCGDRTYEGYRSICVHHLKKGIGNLPLKTVTGHAIQTFYAKEGEKVARRTLNHIHRVLSQAMRWAMVQGYIGRNPCELVAVKVPRTVTMRAMTPAELDAVLKADRDSYYFPVVYMAVSSGLRQGELLGLRWRDLDLDLCTISVNQVLDKRNGTKFHTPKTAYSKRRVDMSPRLAAYLREYRKQREIVYLEYGKVLSLDSLVFESIHFEPLNPSVVAHQFRMMTVKAGIRGVRFHDLRHTFASLALLRGVSAKVISEILGHSSVAFTMATYAHVISGMQRDAMRLLDEVIPDVTASAVSQRQINGKNF